MIKEFKLFFDKRGSLMPVDHSELPFMPQRSFVVKDVPYGAVRGSHAHYQTQQFIICLSGHCIVYLATPHKTMIISLKKGQGVYIPELTWDAQWFGKNTSVIVYASTKYDPKDYITEWEVFKRDYQAIVLKRTLISVFGIFVGEFLYNRYLDMILRKNKNKKNVKTGNANRHRK